jgi:hypothetical protein
MPWEKNSSLTTLQYSVKYLCVRIMKRIFALLLALFYVVFSVASLRAEASLLENKESQENIFSVKQGEENTANHVIKAPRVKKAFIPSFDKTLIAEERVQSYFSPLIVPLFLKHCNFRR